MALSVRAASFRFPSSLRSGVEGRRVLITGAGKDKGLGQAFALGAGLNGATNVGVHFHTSGADAFDLVDAIQAEGGKAFPIQADVTLPGDVWATRRHVEEAMPGPVDLLFLNSGRSESGYLFGRAPRTVEGESIARRRARVRGLFVGNLEKTRDVVVTKVDGFLNFAHLWIGQALHHSNPLQIVVVSSRQAYDPGAGVPGYAMANFAALGMDRVIRANLGKDAGLVSTVTLALPFVRTGLTEAYADNRKVFGRWQPRMLEGHEAARAVLQLLTRPKEELDGNIYQLNVDPDPSSGEGAIKVTWTGVKMRFEGAPVTWSAEDPLVFVPPTPEPTAG